MDSAKTKGQTYNYTKEFLLEKFGAEAIDKVANQLAITDRAVVTDTLFTNTWEPLDVFTRFLEEINNLFGSNDERLCEAIGCYAANKTIPKFYKLYVKFGDPSHVISRADRLWGHVNDTGDMVAQQPDKNTVIIQLKNIKYESSSYCRYVAGYCIGMLELSGAKKIELIVSKSVAKGDAYCEFLGKWK